MTERAEEGRWRRASAVFMVVLAGCPTAYQVLAEPPVALPVTVAAVISGTAAVIGLVIIGILLRRKTR